MGRQATSLKPHDVCVALQLVITPRFTFRQISEAVGLSVGESHNSVGRLEVARLFQPHQDTANVPGLLEFLISGVPYAFPGVLGPETRGVPTAHSGPAFESIASVDPVVWPSAKGQARGLGLPPLCKAAPAFKERNEVLYRWLTIVDALRIGRARDRGLARDLLKRELTTHRAQQVAWTTETS